MCVRDDITPLPAIFAQQAEGHASNFKQGRIPTSTYIRRPMTGLGYDTHTTRPIPCFTLSGRVIWQVTAAKPVLTGGMQKQLACRRPTTAHRQRRARRAPRSTSRLKRLHGVL